MASTPSKPAIDPELVRELAGILNDTDLTEIEVEKGELKIRVARETAAAPAPVYAAAPAPAPLAPAPAPAAAAAAPAAPAPQTKAAAGAVTSPMVGTVYLRPSPDSDQFKKVGDSVSEGDTILLVEAMKTYNPITAPKSGTLTELMVDDAQPVEYGEALFVIS